MAANIISIIILLCLSAFFSASETGLSTASRIRLKTLAATGDKRASRALAMSENFDKTLTTILVGNNVVNTASAAVCTMLFTELFGASGVGIATAIMTIAVLIFGEVLPKSIAKENSIKVSQLVSGPLSLLSVVLTPVTWLFSQLKKGVSRVLKSDGGDSVVTEDELKYIIDESEEQGVLEEQESDLVKSALEFDDIEVSRILIPRVNVVAVEANMPLEEIQRVFLEEMYTRLPVYEKTVDSIIGVINEKDFFKLMVQGGTSIKEIMTETMYISEMKLISEVLREMQKAKVHMAIVVDQYGGTQGIVTLEDIIEELVGEIYDENDEVVPQFVEMGQGTYQVSGQFSVADFLDELELPPETIDTERTSVGGWVMECFGRIPSQGEMVESSGFRLTADQVEEQKIALVTIEETWNQDKKEAE